ncbi:MAG: tRNA (adenosine(37)-N6)-threonylcarbamoyltransferase complex dimerization subunit type 1 TsaB [Thermodesulfobacteriota bacterium]
MAVHNVMVETKQDNRELILAVDTASSCSSIAVSRGGADDGTVLAELSLNSRVTHSRRLLGSIDYLLGELDIGLADLNAFSVGLGPGSFTGLRIGMATMKGLAVAAARPLVGVSTLDSLAFSCCSERLICVVLDARKKEVYSAFYQKKGNNSIKRLSPIRALAPSQLINEINEPVLLVGDGLTAYGDFFREELGEYYRSAPVNLVAPSSSAIGLLGCEMLRSGNHLDPAASVPLYVRGSDAELSLKKVSP